MIIVASVVEERDLHRPSRLDRETTRLAQRMVAEERSLLQGLERVPSTDSERYGDVVMVMCDKGSGQMVREKVLSALADRQSINYGQLPVGNCPECGSPAQRLLREAQMHGFPTTECQCERGHWWTES